LILRNEWKLFDSEIAMTLEQLWRYLGIFGFIVVPTLSYVLVRRNAARQERLNNQSALSGNAALLPNLSAMPWFLQPVERLSTKYLPKFKPWMLLPSIICGIVLIINEIERATSLKLSMYAGAVLVMTVPALAYGILRQEYGRTQRLLPLWLVIYCAINGVVLLIVAALPPR